VFRIFLVRIAARHDFRQRQNTLDQLDNSTLQTMTFHILEILQVFGDPFACSVLFRPVRRACFSKRFSVDCGSRMAILNTQYM
jgi:hypothetical protein